MEAAGISHWEKFPPITLNANWHNYTNVRLKLMGMSFFFLPASNLEPRHWTRFDLMMALNDRLLTGASSIHRINVGGFCSEPQTATWWPQERSKDHQNLWGSGSANAERMRTVSWQSINRVLGHFSLDQNWLTCFLPLPSKYPRHQNRAESASPKELWQLIK